jgi:hypothetical protein
MLSKIDKWICEILLYIDYKQKEKGMDGTFRGGFLLVLSSTMFIIIISAYLLVHILGFQVYELIPPIVPISLSSILFFLLYIRYHYKDNYVLISEKQGFQKKIFGIANIYIICTFALMWILIILAVITE